MDTSQTKPQGAVRTRNVAVVALGWALGTYLLWCAATYLLEGRVGLIMHPTVAGRVIYTSIANILIGTIGATFAIRAVIGTGITTPERLGFRSARRTAIAVAIAAICGSALYLQGTPPELQRPLVVLNSFKNLLATSTAEVLICWVLIGGAVEGLLRPRGRVLAVVAAIVAAELFFGIYHYAHSEPFNQTWMVLFLLIPGFVTSLVYFLGRDLYATVLTQNFLAMIGLGRNSNTAFLEEVHIPLYLIGLAGLIALVAADLLIIRRGAARPRVVGGAAQPRVAGGAKG